MFMPSLPKEPQPDVLPEISRPHHPSLWLYAILLVLSAILIWIAFCLQERPDWPSLLLNIAAGLIGAVVVLLFVEKRIRSDEIKAIQQIPFPISRVGWLRRQYLKRLLPELESRLKFRLTIPVWEPLETHVREGFALLAPPGSGKTTWLQMVARSLVSKELSNSAEGRIPVIFPLREWRDEHSLEEALLGFVLSFCKCSKKTFKKILSSGKCVLIFDGYDELSDKRSANFLHEVAVLKAKSPSLACSVTSRPQLGHRLEPVFGKSVELPRLTDEQIEEINRLRDLRRILSNH